MKKLDIAQRIALAVHSQKQPISPRTALVRGEYIGKVPKHLWPLYNLIEDLVEEFKIKQDVESAENVKLAERVFWQAVAQNIQINKKATHVVSAAWNILLIAANDDIA